MKPKTFAILLIVVCILAAVAMMTSRTKRTEGLTVMGTRLVSALPLGDIAAITITSPEAAVNLTSTSDGWTVANRFGYPADFSKISELVQQLSGAKVGRSFAMTPEVQARLALFPPEPPDPPAEQKGTRIVLADKDAKALTELIIGKPREESAGAAPGTSYVLRPSENQVFLIDQNFRFLEKKPAGWLNKKPINLKSQQIQKVVCFDTRRNRLIYTLERPAENQDPVLTALPAGKKMAKYKADQVFEALTPLTIEDVADPGRKDAAERFDGPPRFDYTLYDGTVYHVFPGNALKAGSENHYLRAAVSYLPPPEKKDPPPKENRADPAAEAEKQNQRLSPWTYVVSKWVYDSFISDPQNLMEEAEKK